MRTVSKSQEKFWLRSILPSRAYVTLSMRDWQPLWNNGKHSLFLKRTLQNPLQKIRKILIGLERPPHTLFFRFKQIHFLEIAWIFPPHWSPLNVHAVSRPWCPSLSNHNGVTPGLTHLIGRQGKHVWLIVRQLPMKAGWWDALIVLRDLARAICMYAKIWLFMSSLIHKVSFCLANIFSSKMFGCHCQLVTVHCRRCCWTCVVVFPHFIMAAKSYV